jgi:AhpD family alkylhydroperoxidase
MKKILTAILLIMTFVQILPAQESESDPNMKAESEMKATFGTVPAMFKVLPDHLRASAWEWFKANGSPDAALSAKYTQLIALGVASQIPCDYYVYAHTTQAKMYGATDAEIQEAVASASETRYWSTVLNGNDVPFDEFKKEWDGILEYVKKQSEGK